MQRRKPEDNELTKWCQEWDLSTHVEKLILCDSFGITYDTGKHWRSETNIPKVLPVVEKAVRDEGEEMNLAVGEILALQPRIHLDFVSFDIETTNLTADFSILLSACIKPYGKDPIVFRADNYPEWVENRANDGSICHDITTELSKHAIIVTHYGTGFDIPYIRAKMAKYGLPPLPPMFGVDTYSIAKRNFRLSRRRLAALAEYFELGKKEGVEGGLWLEASLSGNKEAMDKIVAHNIQDCVILEKLAAISYPYLKSIRKL